MSRCMMIVNPTSGREKAKYYKDDLYAQLQTMFDEVELRETRRSGDAANWAKEASNNNYEAVFSMGGDGTLNETVNGLARPEKKSSSALCPWGQ